MVSAQGSKHFEEFEREQTEDKINKVPIIIAAWINGPTGKASSYLFPQLICPTSSYRGGRVRSLAAT